MWSVCLSECEAPLAVYKKAKSMAGAMVDEVMRETGATRAQVLEARSGIFEDMASAEANVFEGVAHIHIVGLLLASPDPFLDLYGVEYSDYATISAQVRSAESDANVDSIVLHVKSGGGMVEGMFAAGEVIRSATKQTTARVSSLAASAAYYLASQADAIEASHESDRFGSVGVCVDVYVSDDVVSIASSNAPNKRPDLRTDSGRQIVKSQLDQVEGLFLGGIAKGRSAARGAEMTPEQVAQDFGGGGLMIASLAVAAGMADSISEGEANEMQFKDDTQVTGIRAALGLDSSTGKEDLFRAALEAKQKADAFDDLKAQHDQMVALNEAAKDQLKKAVTEIESLKAEGEERKKKDFEARRDGVLNAALEESKILPAQVDQFKNIAKDEAGLEHVVDLLATTKSMGLTTADPNARSPKGKTPEETPASYAKTYGVSIESAKRRLAERKEAS